jgi:hypothetical protein
MNKEDIKRAVTINGEIELAKAKLSAIKDKSINYVEAGHNSIKAMYLSESTIKTIAILVEVDLKIYIADREQVIANL